MSNLVVLGHVTKDLIAGNERLGGAASYVSLTAAHLGMDVTLVTAAPADFALMQPLHDAPRITLHCLPSQTVTTFVLDYSGVKRRVRLLECAELITKTPVTAPWVFLAPVMDELPVGCFDWFPGSRIVVGLQGWMRAVGNGGRMVASDPPPLELLTRAHAIAFSEHDHPQALRLARRLATRVPIVVVTRGARGATLFDAGVEIAIAPAPADEKDPTGAGDVFAAALTVALAENASAVEAAHKAAFAAARAVEGPGLGTLTATQRP